MSGPVSPIFVLLIVVLRTKTHPLKMAQPPFLQGHLMLVSPLHFMSLLSWNTHSTPLHLALGARGLSYFFPSWHRFLQVSVHHHLLKKTFPDTPPHQVCLLHLILSFTPGNDEFELAHFLLWWSDSCLLSSVDSKLWTGMGSLLVTSVSSAGFPQWLRPFMNNWYHDLTLLLEKARKTSMIPRTNDSRRFGFS